VGIHVTVVDSFSKIFSKAVLHPCTDSSSGATVCPGISYNASAARA
jgi:hypothetical protein